MSITSFPIQTSTINDLNLASSLLTTTELVTNNVGVDEKINISQLDRRYFNTSLFTGKGIYFESDAIWIDAYKIALVDFYGELKYFSGAATSISGVSGPLTGGVWYVAKLDSVGTFSVDRPSAVNLTISGNQLNCLSIYDKDYDYMRHNVSGSRIVGIFKTNAGLTGIDYIQTIYDKPKSYVYANTNAAQSIANNSATVIEFATILVDTNSEFNANGTFTPQKTGVYHASLHVMFALTAWNAGSVHEMTMLKDAVVQEYVDRKMHGNAITDYSINKTSVPVDLNYNQALTFAIRHDQGIAVALMNVDAFNWIRIGEI